MKPTETPEEAKTHANTALARMAELGIAPYPWNFETWYAYATGKRAELSRTIDILRSNGREFSDQLNGELHQQFFRDAASGVPDPANDARVETLIDQVVTVLSQAGVDSARYGSALASFEGTLAAAGRDLPGLLAGLVAETRRMADRNRALETRLGRSAEEIEALRQDLIATRLEAMTDALTGVVNRKCFDGNLRDAAAHALETGEPLSLLIADIDHFKQFNDRWGHQVGDQVLRIVGRFLNESIKGRDTAARYGGEEFAVILPVTELADGATLAEQICRMVSGRHIVKRDTREDLGFITLSIGVGQYRPGEPIATLIDRVDDALYTAKRCGRNRVITEAMVDPAAPVEIAIRA